MTVTWTSRVRKTFHGIKGMTDRPSITPRLPAIGRLRKGTTATRKRQDGTTYEVPIDLEYFLFTSDNEEVVKAFGAAYGAQPRLLNVRLPYPTPEENFQTAMEEWRGGGLVHRCDGETMSLWIDGQGLYHEDPRPCPYCGHPELRVKADKKRGVKANPGCLEVGRLNVFVPELLQAGFVGVVTLVTTAVNDILAINNTLYAIAEEQEEYERSRGQEPHVNLRGILWNLRRVPEAISTPGENGGRVRRVKWLVKIEPAPEWALLQLEMARRAALPELPEPWQPQAPDWEDVTTNGRTLAEAEAEAEEAEYRETQPTATEAPGFAEVADEEEAAAAPGAAAQPPSAAPGNGPTPAAAWLSKHGKIVMACRQAHTYLTPQQIAERLSSLGVDPAAGAEVAVDALNRPAEQPGLFPAEEE